MVKEKILVSACFVKNGYKYNGDSNYNEKVLALKDKYDFILICPECFGMLPVPRVPSERLGNKVVNKNGDDVTKAFQIGAEKALSIALENNCTKAVLKARSPSCGKGLIYDGTFSHTIIEGNGVAAEILEQHGIKIYTEDEIEEIL